MEVHGRLRVVVVDANILINMIYIDRLDLLGALSSFEFLAPEQVVAEVSNPEHSRRLADALEEGHLHPIASTDLIEIQDYAELRQIMGKGEAACLAIASGRGWLVASDERGRFLRHASERLGEGRLLNTLGLIVLMIREGLIDVDQADEFKKTLENHRFRMRFGSFRDVL